MVARLSLDSYITASLLSFIQIGPLIQAITLKPGELRRSLLPRRES